MSAPIEAADLACLRAAASRTLIRKRGDNWLLPESIMNDTGWWAQSNWGEHQEDPTLGGPWSIERVSKLCELGFLGVSTRDLRANLTKAGRAALKDSKAPKVRAPVDGAGTASTPGTDAEGGSPGMTTRDVPPPKSPQGREGS